MQRLVLLLGIAAFASSTVHAEEPAANSNEIAIKAAPAPSSEADSPKKVVVTLRLVEIDVTVLRRKGFDFSITTQQGVDTLRMAQLHAVTDKVLADSAAPHGSSGNAITPCGTFRQNHPFLALLDALQRQKLAIERCAPNIVTENGRTASYRVGSEFPIGRTADGKDILRFAGTSAEVLTRRHPNEQVHVKFALFLSEIDTSRSIKSGGFTIPALKLRECVTEFDAGLGETWVCSGLTEKRSVATGKKAKAAASEHEFRQIVLVTTHSIDEPLIAGKPLPAPSPTSGQPAPLR